MAREEPKLRVDFKHFSHVETRWMDNDIYGHVNNVVYYSYFDSVINRYLISEGGLDIHHGAVIGVCVESGCRYFDSFAFPEVIDAGLRVARVGGTSVTYEVGLFRRGVVQALAQGHFVHVFVDRSTRRPLPIPDRLRLAFRALVDD